MISTSKLPRYSAADLASIRIGESIHKALADEARRETASRKDGSFVHIYLDHSLLSGSRLPFVKYDSRDGMESRKFSKEIAARIRHCIPDLKIYFDHVRAKDRLDDSGSRIGREPPAKVLTPTNAPSVPNAR